MRVEGHVGPSTTVDGQEGVALRQGKSAELVITQLHGKYYEQVSRGNTYYGMSATGGIALIVAATGGGHPMLFNPMGSNVNLSVTHLYLSWCSGACVPGGIFWAYVLNAGASQATAAPIATATYVASVNALLGSQRVAKGLWSPTTNTFTTTAPVLFMGTGIGMTTMISSSTGNPNPLVVAYDGTLVVSPGNAICLVHSAANTALFNVTVVWEEVPI